MSKGIDILIDNLLVDLTARLWTTNVNLFSGRIFRNEVLTENGLKIVPEIYIDGNDYKDVLKDDRYDAQCFFDVLPSGEMIGTMEKNTVRAMFMVNLIKLYPTLLRNEATESAKKDVFDILSCNFDNVSGFVSGRTAFSDYEFKGNDVSDMSPHYLFRFDCVSYNVNC
jgi:hypothetical protein